MKEKTMVHAEDGKQELKITRQFDLPVDLLFKAHVEPELVEQWMGTKVVKLEAKPHGSWAFETTDPQGNKYRFNGVIHEFVPEQKITRTFEMESSNLPVQLEFFTFEKVDDETSRLTMHIIFKSQADRDHMVTMGMPRGLNMAHNRLEQAALKYRADKR